jgi:hypothetical protein
MLIAIPNLGTTGTLNDDPGADYFSRLHRDRAKNRVAMGYHVTLDHASSPGPDAKPPLRESSRQTTYWRYVQRSVVQ